MPRRAATITQADISRAIRAARQAGAAEVEVRLGEQPRIIVRLAPTGEATALEVVDAQNTLTTTRNAYHDGQARYHVAIANLQTLTGAF